MRVPRSRLEQPPHYDNKSAYDYTNKQQPPIPPPTAETYGHERYEMAPHQRYEMGTSDSTNSATTYMSELDSRPVPKQW